jgi:hypothetical protein
MVTPTPNARTQRGATPTFEPRLRLRTVSVSGKPDFKARDNSAEIASTPEFVSAETIALTVRARLFGAFWRKAGNSVMASGSHFRPHICRHYF